MIVYGLDDLPWSRIDAGAIKPVDLIQIVEELSDFVTGALAEIWAHDLYSWPRFGSVSLSDLLFGDCRDILPRDIRLRAQIVFDRRIKILGESTETASQVKFRGSVHLAPTTAWMCDRIGAGGTVASVTANRSDRVGPLIVLVDTCERHLEYIVDESTERAFFRRAIDSSHCDEDGFERLAPFAFPKIVFLSKAIRGLRDLSRPFRDRRSELVKIFSAVSDNVDHIFSSPNQFTIQSKFDALGVSVSPENRATIADRNCRTQREASFRTKTFIFDWHIKVEAHVDRIHFHAPVPESEQKMLVGVIHAHLETKSG
jgi:hypothetical protein